MIQAIHEHQEHGDYNSMTDGNDFAEALVRDLRAVSHDQHLFVGYDPFMLCRSARFCPGPHEPSPAEQARFRAMLEHQNCTFSKLEILNHNVGYVKFDAFPPPEFCAPTVVAAMNFVANTDALIFDLRENHGGDPEMVDFMVSYLFREPTHINDLTAGTKTRHTNIGHSLGFRASVSSISPCMSSPRMGRFSGGEEFTFDLKTQKRATIVGEATGGGAILCVACPLETTSPLAFLSHGPSTRLQKVTGKEQA